MSLTILKAGVCDTIQDLGRFGYGALGINPSGAMDLLALQCANALVANPLPTAAIELHFPASIIRFNIGVVVTLSGANFNAIITEEHGNTISLPVNKTAFIPANAVLSFNKKIAGERCYLAVQGGFELHPWLNSFSTNLNIKQGGIHGEAFKKGITLSFAKPVLFKQSTTKLAPWTASFYSWYADEGTCNILPGPEWDWMDDASRQNLSRKRYSITPISDRMGISLNGTPLTQVRKEQLVSTGVTYGTVQLLPNGQLVILAADHPTIGGYPRIANIISAHLPKLAQASVNTNLRFLETTFENATDLLLMQQKELRQMQQAVRLQLESFIQ